MAGEGATAILARHAAQVRFEDLPPGAVRAAKRSLIDAIGVSLAASGLGEGCAAFADEAREAGQGPCTVLGFGFTAPPLAAALANGALAHALDFEDVYDGAPIHPNAALVPAALAVAEAKGGVSGPDLLAALAVGCDLVCRLGLALRTNPDAKGFYPPPILGSFGAAAAAGRVLGLTAAQMEDAFALTLGQAIASSQFKTTPDSMVRAVRDAFAAHAGALSARLASRGVRGFEGAFEGKAGFYALYGGGDFDAAVLLGDLGKRFEGERVGFKPWPACRGTHAAIEGALALAEAHNLRPDDIAEVVLTGAALMTMLAEPVAQKQAPATAIDAKFSLPFTVAVALVHREVTLERYFAPGLADREVLKLAKRVRFEVEERFTGLAASVAGTIAIRLTNGRVLKASRISPLGAPDNPLSDEDLRGKFLACAAHAARPVDAEAFLARVEALESAADVSGLLTGP